MKAPGRRGLKGRLRTALTIGATALLTGIVVAAAAAHWIAPFDPYEQELTERLLPPFSGGHVLGNDHLGRDILSRLLWAARPSLLVGGLTMVLAGSVGLTLGLLGGFFGGRVDAAVRGLVSVRLSFPMILLVLALVTVLRPGLRTTVVALSLTLWVQYAVVVRSEVLSLRAREFVDAARAVGARNSRIVVRHILPNTVNSIIVVGSYNLTEAILAEAFLSFLGLGVQPPVPSWGNMLAEARVYALSMWWIAAFPGAAIFLTTLSIILLGDGLRDFLDPLRAR